MQFHSFNNLFLFGLPLVIGLSACQPEQSKTIEVIRPIVAMKIGSTTEVSDSQLPGVARATQEVELSFRVPGTLQKMLVKIGQEVRLGDTLAILDQRDFKIGVDNAKASLANTDAQLTNAKIEFDRIIKIQKSSPGVVSQSMVDQRLTSYNTAKAMYASSRAQLNAAEDKLSYTLLKAPFDGVIVQRYVENYQDVMANNPVFRLVDISKIEMDISIPENQISHLSYVKNPRVTFDNFPGIEIPATIKEVSNEASLATRTYNVRLIMEPPLGIDILPGMSGYATADVILPGEVVQVIVPLSAMFSSADNKKTYVWIYDVDTQLVTKVVVEKGGITDRGLIVTKGLNSGDWIVTAGVNFLTEGQKVRLLDTREAG